VQAVCCDCIEDRYLKKIIADEGEPLERSERGDDTSNALTIKQLAEVMEPIGKGEGEP
jgi:hypothetical protein